MNVKQICDKYGSGYSKAKTTEGNLLCILRMTSHRNDSQTPCHRIPCTIRSISSMHCHLNRLQKIVDLIDGERKRKKGRQMEMIFKSKLKKNCFLNFAWPHLVIGMMQFLICLFVRVHTKKFVEIADANTQT